MDITFLVAGEAGDRCGFHFGDRFLAVMTLDTIYRLVFPDQSKGQLCMAERLAIRLNAIMTSQAAWSISREVSLHENHVQFLMAG